MTGLNLSWQKERLRFLIIRHSLRSNDIVMGDAKKTADEI